MTDFWQRLAAAPPGIPQPLAVDPDGFLVYLSRRRWEGHILPGHEHIRFIQDLVVPAITDPDDREFEDPVGQIIRYYHRIPRGRHSLFPDHWMKVVVKYRHPAVTGYKRTGLVSTAYPDRRRGRR